MLLEYMKDIDDKLFKKCSDGKDVNSFIKEFDCATNEKYKEKLVKELKDINGLVQITLKWRLILVNTNVNYLILLMLLIILCVNTLKYERVILIGEEQSKIIKYFM